MSITMKRRPGTDVTKGSTPNDKLIRLNVLANQLKQARMSFEATWKDIATLFRPRRIRLQVTDRNKGDQRSQRIVDSTTVFAARTAAAGIMSVITSPARIWVNLVVADDEMMKQQAVKEWLEEVRDAMIKVLNRSNFYEILSTFYSDLCVFGTTALITEEDDEKVIRCTHFALGEYWIGYNATQQVRVFMREYELTVQQVVDQFGIPNKDGYDTKNFSEPLVAKWNSGQTQAGVTVTHIIYENPEFDPKRINAKYKRFASCYYETTGQKDRFLLETGYNEWPVGAVRWETTTGDVYGTDCPGMTAMPDARELMFTKKIGAQALNKNVNPPMLAPLSFRNYPLTQLPGGVTYADETSDKTMRPTVDTRAFRLDWLKDWKNDLRDMIDKAFYVDLFLIISNIDRSNVTATEVLEKKEEKLLTLGPVGKQIDGGFLDPFFERLYGIMFRKGLIPQPPPEMAGVTFHPEYETILAQAQRSQGRAGIEAFGIFYKQLLEVDPSIAARVDVDEIIQRYAEVTGNPPNFIRSDEAVEAIRQAEAQAAAKQQAAEQAEMVANSANKLANSPTGDKNALTDLLSSGAPSNALGGATSPSGGY